MPSLIKAVSLVLLMIWLYVTLRAVASHLSVREFAPRDDSAYALSLRRVHRLLWLGPVLIIVVACVAWIAGVPLS